MKNAIYLIANEHKHWFNWQFEIDEIDKTLPLLYLRNREKRGVYKYRGIEKGNIYLIYIKSQKEDFRMESYVDRWSREQKEKTQKSQKGQKGQKVSADVKEVQKDGSLEGHSSVRGVLSDQQSRKGKNRSPENE